VKVDLADDRFDVSYTSDGTTPESLLTTVRNLGFECRIVVVKMSGPDAAVPVQSIDLQRLPGEFAALFLEARRTDKPVLLDFGSPG